MNPTCEQQAHDYGWSNHATMHAVDLFYGAMRYDPSLRHIFDAIVNQCNLHDGHDRDDWETVADALKAYAHLMPQTLQNISSDINWKEIAQDTIDYMNHG